MIDAYVINLEKDAHRKEMLTKNINDLDVNKHINVNFIKAVEESTFSEHNFTVCNTWFDKFLKTGITIGEVGCSLSHNKCWNEFYNSNKECAIILEDDVEFTHNYYEKLQILMDYPKDADIVYINRKALKNDEIKYDDNFTIVKASYWLCAYLLTKSGVEKLLKTKFTENLIVVDELLPLLYDNNYLSEYQKYYNNVRLNAYAIENNSLVKLRQNAFFQSNTFHSKYYKYDNKFIVVTSDLHTSLSSMDRFIYSCEKYSLNYKIMNDTSTIMKWLHSIDEDKIIIIVCDSNYSFFINNPLQIFFQNNDAVYSNFNNLNEFISGYNKNTIFFYGKKISLTQILNHSTKSDNSTIEIVKNLTNEDTNYSVSNDNFIIVNGIDNKLLLNKYENYILRKVYKSYGYNHGQILNNYNFKIRVNVMVYTNNYKYCIKHLKKMDYASDLLDIHVYTDKDCIDSDFLNDTNVQIHKSNIFDAYNDMYNYYKNYDYIWLINSEYIITDNSLLKNCVNVNKNIISGLQASKNTLFSNFWGDITKSGWYQRSDDYIDILKMNNINIWNVPFVNGNLLIKTSILNKYNLFQQINYDKQDHVNMILCENLRLYNESIYLLNNKMYGYTCEELGTLPSWSEETILHEDFYDFIHNNKNDIFNEVGTDIWNIPFLSVDFCKYLIKISEQNGDWSKGVYTNDSVVDKRIGAVENIPTQDIHLKDLNLEKFWLHVVDNYFKKILSHLYNYKTKDYNIAFIVKYDYDNGQRLLKPHHDSSVYTINIALNSSNEYTGGGVNFIHKKCVYFNKNPGYLLLHPGRITHYHEALPITSGKRYVLVSFNN